jgi:choline kinase
VLHALESVGIRTVHAVVGANADDVMRGANECLPAGLALNRIDNADWRRQNGVSVLAAAAEVDQPFLLTMGDHLFEPSILHRLLSESGRDRVSLAIDRKINDVFDLADAMKVRTAGRSIIEIGKDIGDFDAIDTGVFLCTTEIFSYLERAKIDGDCSLADGVRLMAHDKKFDGVDTGDAWWQDVDTPAMLERAERQLPESLRVMFGAPAAGG